MNDVEETVGGDNLSTPAIIVYPNPVDVRLTIKGVEGKAELNIYTLLAVLVKTVKLNSASNSIDMAEIEPSVSILEIIDSNKNVTISRISKL